MSRGPLLLGLSCASALLVAGWLMPDVALRGWLIGFTWVGGMAFGAVAWRAIHALTGGGWGEMARTSWLCAARALPLLLLLGLPLLLGAAQLYPWARDPGSAGSGVAAAYLNRGFWGFRSLFLIGGLSIFVAWLRDSPSRLVAGLCLLVYAVGMDLAAFDWVLSLDPRVNASSIGMNSRSIT